MKKPEDLVGLAVAVLSGCGAKFALIGGCARNIYAPPRATRDADFAAALDDQQLRAVIESFAKHGFMPATSVSADPSDPVPDLILFQDAGGQRIDILIAKSDFEDTALARACLKPAFGVSHLPVVTAEDLLVYKLLASRPRDLADAEEIVRTQERAGRGIDWGYVEKHCATWEVEAQLANLRKRVD